MYVLKVTQMNRLGQEEACIVDCVSPSVVFVVAHKWWLILASEFPIGTKINLNTTINLLHDTQYYTPSVLGPSLL